MMMAIKPLCRNLLLASLLFISLTGAMQAIAMQNPPRIYAIQLESSRNPEMRDYAPIRKYGKLYTYREISGKHLRRVRLGYYQSRDQARKILEKIRSMGFKQAYITRIKRHPGSTAAASTQPLAKRNSPTKPIHSKAAETDISVSTATATIPGKHYAIQLESSLHPRLADYKSIEQWGTLYIYQHQAGVGLQRVRLGYYDKLEDARSALIKIMNAGFGKAYITHVHPSSQRNKPPPVAPKPPAQATPVKTAEQKTSSVDKKRSLTGNIISTFDYVVPDPFDSAP